MEGGDSMSTLKDQLFLEFAAEALSDLTDEYRDKFTSKRGDRFNVQGLTYEVGALALKNNLIQFEVSSKIPGDELSETMTEAKYFKAVSALVKKGKHKPLSIDMENIVRNTLEESKKERDYVKVTYGYKETDLYNEKEIAKQIKNLEQKQIEEKLPDVPGITTVGGRLVLMTFRQNLRDTASENIQRLIDANNEVRKGLKKK